MKLRPLGRSGIEVSPLCFGGNVFGWTADEAASHAMLDRFVDAGFNFIDTANVYSFWVDGHQGGESESVIGRWLRKSGKRDRVVIATKVGMAMPELGEGLDRARIERSVDDSLRRLQTDRIDLFYAHKDDDKTPMEETLAAFDRLVRAGKVRTIGASNFSGARLEQALALSQREGLARYECLQPQYNLVDRQPFESDLAPVCLKHGVAVANFFSLASGFLSGKYHRLEDTEGRARAPRLKNYFNDRGMRILEALLAVSTRLGTTPSTVAIAWTMAQPSITSAIASATSVAQLDELLRAAELRIDAASMAQLQAASAA
ncbi:aldo/keto reductase [Piscinibacter terrae]|uniref:Aldo/keto reductase n=1 Tax=Piscinibacter terrae TaxID=2496871 RepID=A0A3N7HU70_9BURK|nr:aldo/keto reductase [Albitalea terrae]RQP25877.1 aldo/keto reductase [Albitalea terrae]